MDSNNHFYTHALAAGARINPTEKLHLLVGGRYTHWKRDFNYNWSRYAGAPDNDAKPIRSKTANSFHTSASLTISCQGKTSMQAIHPSTNRL